MKEASLSKHLATVAAGAVLSFGVVAQASAAPYFSYDANGQSGAGPVVVTANAVNGGSSESLYVTGVDTFSGRVGCNSPRLPMTASLRGWPWVCTRATPWM